MDYNYKKRLISTTQVIVLSFMLSTFLGAILLSLPFAAQSGQPTPFIDALFTATTSLCVTGLVTVTTATHWSLFGKIVILLLIQIGGMGVVAIAMMVFMLLGGRMSLGYRMLLGDSLNLDSLSGIVIFLRKVFLGTFIAEGVGALCCMPVFIADYGVIKGIWFSVFHSVSAFCNAGIDIIGESSLQRYVHHPWMNMVTMALIILGGIGFVVWWDVINVIKRKQLHLSLHTKIVLSMTSLLILGGAICYLAFEYNNPDTIGNFGFLDKCLACLFQSVTSRTAGFASMSQKGLTIQSVLITIMLMFVGGSSIGTAGGVKTGTVAVILIAVKSTVRGQKDITAFGKRIPFHTLAKSIAVVTISVAVSLVALMLMFMSVEGSGTDIVYEVYSALGTAGLSRDFTAGMNVTGKLIICVCMFLGRIGPMSMVIAFTVKSKNESVRYIEEDITVG